MNSTIEYYNRNAETFAEGTRGVTFGSVQDRFTILIPVGGYILDFGCGSGRDTKHFLNQGFLVDATDGSEELCRVAGEYAGIHVRHMYFQELDAQQRYDGIWACASILHLSVSELQDVFPKMWNALKADGILYTSFKYGTFSGERNGRFFTDMTEESFQRLLDSISIEGKRQFSILDLWITGDARKGREEEKWLNVILKKKNIL